MDVLYVNACVRPASRTKQIADYLLARINETDNAKIKELVLTQEHLQPLDNAELENRVRLAKERQFDDVTFEYALEYAAADMIVMAVPLWDMSFPAIFKIYIERINVNGIVFTYDINGKLHGLCKAKQIIYVTTSGGPIFSENFGFGYVKALAQTYHGIEQVTCIKVENLDIMGSDPQKVVRKLQNDIDLMRFV